MSDTPRTSAVPHELPPVRVVEPERVFAWLGRGWRDIWKAGLPSLMHGVLVTLCSIGIVLLTTLRWELVMIAVSCFLIIGPFLATGLYALSQSIEKQDKPSMQGAVHAWTHACRCLFRFGLMLVLACVAWVAFSLAMFYFFVDVSIENPADFLRYVLTQHDGLFVLWSVLGGLVSALAFAVTVVSMPLMVDRNVTTWTAIRTSIRAVGNNPFTMLWWSMAILVLTGVSLITGMLGFLILYPLMGHASWHVYRDLVDPSGLPTYPNGQ